MIKKYKILIMLLISPVLVAFISVEANTKSWREDPFNGKSFNDIDYTLIVNSTQAIDNIFDKNVHKVAEDFKRKELDEQYFKKLKSTQKQFLNDQEEDNQKKIKREGEENDLKNGSSSTVQTDSLPNQGNERSASPKYYSANTLIMNNLMISYQNGGKTKGQSIIDAHPNDIISTWGGTPIFRGNDGLSTHFIGHNPGIFSSLMSEKVGDQILVTDDKTQLFCYKIVEIRDVNEMGTDLVTNEDLYERITGIGEKEQIVLQTCINNFERRIVFATLN